MQRGWSGSCCRDGGVNQEGGGGGGAETVRYMSLEFKGAPSGDINYKSGYHQHTVRYLNPE